MKPGVNAWRVASRSQKEKGAVVSAMLKSPCHVQGAGTRRRVYSWNAHPTHGNHEVGVGRDVEDGLLLIFFLHLDFGIHLCHYVMGLGL